MSDLSIQQRATVLRLVTRLNVGGPGIQALLLTKELHATYPTILAAGSPPPEEGELTDPSVPVTRVPLTRAIAPVNDIRAIRAIRGLIRASGVRIVDTAMAKAGFAGRIAASKFGEVRTVHTFHGHVLDGYFSRPVERAFVAIERHLAKRTDALVAVSEEIRQSLLEMGIGTPERFHVIPLGFDLEPFLSIDARSNALRSLLRIPEDAPLVGVLGRLAPIKNHRALIAACVSLPGVHLAILGDGELRSELEDVARASGHGDRIHFLGWRTDVAACLADMDVVALTSLNEGTPVSLIEAAAAGKPVVSTDVGGVRSVVVDGSTGVLTTTAPEVVARAIGMVLRDREMATSMGHAAREHVRHRFTKARVVSEVGALYDGLLKDRGSP